MALMATLQGRGGRELRPQRAEWGRQHGPAIRRGAALSTEGGQAESRDPRPEGLPVICLVRTLLSPVTVGV